MNIVHSRTQNASSTRWLAPVSPGILKSQVSLPGSKSQSARELILSALAKEPSKIQGLLHSRDTRLMIQALKAFGVGVKIEGDDTFIFPPAQLSSEVPLSFIDCGLAGTVLRFVPVLASLAYGDFKFFGDNEISKRPVLPLLQALQDLGIEIIFPTTTCVPFVLKGKAKVAGGKISIDARQSSQFISALLLGAPRFSKGLDLALQGPAPSGPHIAMTVESLRRRGVQIHELSPDGHPLASKITPSRWRVEPGAIAGGEQVIEPDLSNAGPFLAAAGICEDTSEVKVHNWPKTSTQAGMAWNRILPAFGMQVIHEKNEDFVVRSAGALQAVNMDFSPFGELVPTAAALAAFAQGTSVFYGIGHLRGHETDRLAALEIELSRLGIRAKAGKNDLEITGNPDLGIKNKQLTPILLRSYADHRMATFAALIGLRMPIEVDDISCTDKTLPNFVQLWENLLSQVKHV